MNTVTLTGNLGRDPELKHTQSGTAVTKFSLAVKRAFKKDETDWINIVLFGKTAEVAAEYLKKGSKVGIVGRIQTGSYENDGKKVYTFDVVGDSLEFLDSRGSGKVDQGGITGKVVEDSDESFPFEKGINTFLKKDKGD